MGLDFYIGTGGIDNLGKHIGSLSIEEHVWLQKNQFLIANKNGYKIETEICSIPYYDDTILTHDQVKKVESDLKIRKIEILKTAEFKSTAVDRFENILKIALSMKEGLSTLAD